MKSFGKFRKKKENHFPPVSDLVCELSSGIVNIKLFHVGEYMYGPHKDLFVPNAFRIKQKKQQLR